MSEVARIARAVLASGPLRVESGPAFEIYRNNYRQGLARALSQSFPVVEALVGEPFFAAMALTYVEQTPPTSRLLRSYGDDFAAFIEAFEPAAVVPYLADVARLEFALVEAYYASDEADLPVTNQGALGVESQLAWRSSTRLIRSNYPIVSIWQAHKQGDDLTGLDWRAEVALVVRETNTVSAHLLDSDAGVIAEVFREPAQLVAALEALGPDAAPSAAQALRRLLDLQALHLIS